MAECANPGHLCTGTMTKCTGLGQAACEDDATCCTWTSTGCGGTNSYGCSTSDCPETCCTPTYGCTGESTTNCRLYGSDIDGCNADPCCWWYQGPPGKCAKYGCSEIGEGDCAGCGCSKVVSDCSAKTCDYVGVSNCTSCGCTLSGSCGNKVCSTLANIAQCKSCTGCTCCHQITASCTITSDKTFGTVWVRAGATVSHTGGTVVCRGFGKETGGGWNKANAVSGVPAVQNLGGQCCV